MIEKIIPARKQGFYDCLHAVIKTCYLYFIGLFQSDKW